MLEKEELRSALKQFTGTMIWYKHSLFQKYTYTEGVKFLCENAGCYWLLDKILIHQLFTHPLKDLDLDRQFWTLTVAEDNAGILTCYRDSDEPVFSEELSFTDFPLEEISLWLLNNVLLLPSEY